MRNPSGVYTHFISEDVGLMLLCLIEDIDDLNEWEAKFIGSMAFRYAIHRQSTVLSYAQERVIKTIFAEIYPLED